MEKHDTKRPLILLVDDMPDNLKVLRAILTKENYEVRTAISGSLALSSIRKEAADLILLDIRMPEMDGFEVCRHLKADSQTQDIPVIFLSASDDVDDKVRAFAAGGVDYITKPFKEEEVLVRMETHLRLKKIQKQLEAQNILLQQEIKERRQAEKERREYQNRLLQARKAESLGRMAGAVAHHFNNLLFIVSGNLELVRDDLPPHNQAVQSLDRAENAVQRAIGLSRLMLTYVGQGGSSGSMCDLTEVVSKIAPLVETSLPDNINMQLELSPGLPQVNIAPDELHQIMMNLVENAWESMDGMTGSVRILTGTASCGRSYLEQAAWAGECEPGEYVYLEVADNGCGMSPETIERMFDPFFTTKFTGRGLGLASAAGIVRSCGASIMVSSEPGSGTAVRVLFPVSDESDEKR